MLPEVISAYPGITPLPNFRRTSLWLEVIATIHGLENEDGDSSHKLYHNKHGSACKVSVMFVELTVHEIIIT